MRKIFILFWLCSILSCAKKDEAIDFESSDTDVQGEVEWIKNFGGSGDDSARAIIKTTDGGYAILGFTNSIDGDITTKNQEVNDYWLLKLDSQGNLEWNKTYGGSKDDLGQSLVQTDDGGYALTGYAMSSDGDSTANNGFHDNWLLKLDATGAIEWEHSYGFSGHDHSYDILQTADGGYFFTGFLDITSTKADGNLEKGAALTRHDVGEFLGAKIDKDGGIQWWGYFGGTENDRAHAVVQADDGGYVMAGFTESDDFDVSSTNGGYDFWVIKIDAFGNLVWESALGGSGIDIAYDITKTRDQGFVIVGNTFSKDGDVSINHGESDAWIVKVSSSGALEWENSLGGSGFDTAEAVVESSNGGFLITGNSKSSDNDVKENMGGNDIWVVKTDVKGEIVWQKTIGGSGLDFGYDLVENLDGSILVIGPSRITDFPGIDSKGKTDLVLARIR